MRKEDSGIHRRRRPEVSQTQKRMTEIYRRLDELSRLEALGRIEGLTRQEEIIAQENNAEREKLLAELDELKKQAPEEQPVREEVEAVQRMDRLSEDALVKQEERQENEHRSKYERWKKLLSEVREDILPIILSAEKKFLGIFPHVGSLPSEWFLLHFSGRGDRGKRKQLDRLMISLFPLEAWVFANRMHQLDRLRERSPKDSKSLYPELRQAYEEYLVERPYPGLDHSKEEKNYLETRKERLRQRVVSDDELLEGFEH
jgi:hypothetical protein